MKSSICASSSLKRENNPLEISSQVTVKDIADTIEAFAPRELQESYDNAGLQVGDPGMQVSGILLCLDVTEEVVAEAIERKCNMIVSHHPLLFRGLKQITGATPQQRIVAEALTKGIAIYSAHTNLDSACEGVSYEIGHILGLTDMRPLEPRPGDEHVGLGVFGTIDPVPAKEFLRRVKERFDVRCLRYSAGSPQLVVRRVAVCGGSGASLIQRAIECKADVIVTGDVKYHDFTDWGDRILIADIGHYESEVCSRKMLSAIIRESYPNCQTLFALTDRNPVGYL